MPETDPICKRVQGERILMPAPVAKNEHFSQKQQKISECFVLLTREYTDGGTNIRSKPF
jgi:hypothetical protein